METQKNALSVYTKQREFRKEEGLLYNRLRSIVEDSEFVTHTARLFPAYPLIANLRCGLWYSSKFDGSCYFKSTDGHTHHWKFSKTRLNLHIAQLAAVHGGCLIVDSTRKGKKFPDSFSRTIPIWCATVNRAIAIIRAQANTTSTTKFQNENNSTTPQPTNKMEEVSSVNNTTNDTTTKENDTSDEEYEQESGWDTDLHVPLWVSKTEKAQMEGLVDTFVKSLLDSGADLHPISESLAKPLRPIWVCPSSLLIENMMPDRTKLPFSSIICLSASRVQDVTYFADLQTSAYRYVQGAGDDEEGWARGLKPDVFWSQTEDILGEGPSGIEDRVKAVLKEIEDALGQCITLRHDPSSSLPYTLIGHTGLAVSTALQSSNWRELLDTSPKPFFLNCSPLPYRIQGSQTLMTDGPFYKHFPVNHKKVGKIALSQALHATVPFLVESLQAKDEPQRLMIIHSYESSEIPVCICLAVLAKLFDYEGENMVERSVITKEDMGKFYLLIDKYLPLSLPSRTMRNVINDYLMGPPTNLREPPVHKGKRNNREQDAANTNTND